MAVGTVKYWRDAKGTGAIATEATAPWDIWCHFSAIEGPGFRTLVPGERVEVAYYRGEQGRFKYVAERVRRLDRLRGRPEPQGRPPLANEPLMLAARRASGSAPG